MSSRIIHTCDWCGKEHHSYSREIVCKDGNDIYCILDDLCPTCFNKLAKALWNRKEVVTKNNITVCEWLGSVLVAAALGALICFVIMRTW